MTDRRVEIIDAARELIESNPLNTPTVRDLARAAAMSPAAIYTHFRDLDDVYEHVRASVSRDIMARIAEDLDALPKGEERTVAIHAITVDLILEWPGLYTWMGMTNHLGIAGVEHESAAFMEREFGMPYEAGVKSSELGYLTLAVVPAMAKIPGVTRDQLIDFVATVQSSMGALVREAMDG